MHRRGTYSRATMVCPAVPVSRQSSDRSAMALAFPRANMRFQRALSA